MEYSRISPQRLDCYHHSVSAERIPETLIQLPTTFNELPETLLQLPSTALDGTDRGDATQGQFQTLQKNIINREELNILLPQLFQLFDTPTSQQSSPQHKTNDSKPLNSIVRKIMVVENILMMVLEKQHQTETTIINYEQLQKIQCKRKSILEHLILQYTRNTDERTRINGIPSKTDTQPSTELCLQKKTDAHLYINSPSPQDTPKHAKPWWWTISKW
jgi:hypothetical protein